MMPSSETPHGDIGDGVDDLLEQTTDVVIRKADVQMLSGTYPKGEAPRAQVDSATTEVSVSDFQVVEEIGPPAANPCHEFEKIFAAEIAKALPPLPASPRTPPRAIELMALPVSEPAAFEEPVIPPPPRSMRQRYIVTPAPLPPRKRSRTGWLTAAVVIGCLGTGVLIELKMPDRVDAFIDAAASLMSSAQR